MEEKIKKIATIIARRAKDFRNPNVAFMTTATKTATAIYCEMYRNQTEKGGADNG